MGVRARLLRDILSSLKYIRNLTEQQIRASLWRGEGVLYNIEFDPRRLQELLVDVCPVGLEILELHVDELYVKIPWSQLGTRSVLVVAKNVNVRFNLRCGDEDDWREIIGPMLRRERDKKQQMLYAAPGSLADPAGTLNQLKQRMLHSLQIRADHVRMVLLSEHERHFSAHRQSAPTGPEEALVAEFEDVFLTPCDSERLPSDHMKAMAVYDPSEHVLQLLRLLQCRSFTVSPPAGAAPCASAATEYMDAPSALTCSIVDRSTSDGPRICPVLLSTELLFDFPNPLRIRCCECQLAAFLAMISDLAQLDEWRLDETIMNEAKAELMNTSDVARTFAQGPGPLPRKRSTQREGNVPPQSLIRATSAKQAAKGAVTSAIDVSSSLWSSVSHVAAASGSQRQRTESTSSGCGDSCQASDHATCSADAEEAREAIGGPNPLHHDDPEMEEALSECFDEPQEDEEEEDPYCDVEDLDYFSVCSDLSPQQGSDSPKGSAAWLDTMRSWFGAPWRTTHIEGETTVDLGTQQARIALSIASLVLHVMVPTSDCTHQVDYTGQRLSFCTDVKYELTEAQRECVRRFAFPSEEPAEPLWPWQLPNRVSSTQLLTFPRFSVDFDEEELLRELREDQSEADPMFVLSMRPRSAPPEELVSPDAGKLMSWPSHLSLSKAMFFLHVKGIDVLAGLYKRVKPCLNGKVALPELIAPEGGQVRQQEQQLFPAQCIAIEFADCEFLEPGDACMAAEQRWPFRGFVPHLKLQSNSALWSLTDVLGERSLTSKKSAPGHGDAPPEGMVSIPKEMFDELIRRAADATKKESEVSAARDELQRAYISMATSRPHSNLTVRTSTAAPSDGRSSDGDQDELDELRQKCLQLELSLQSQARSQRRLETELAHHQARAQEELRRLVVGCRNPQAAGMA